MEVLIQDGVDDVVSLLDQMAVLEEVLSGEVGFQKYRQSGNSSANESISLCSAPCIPQSG